MFDYNCNYFGAAGLQTGIGHVCDSG